MTNEEKILTIKELLSELKDETVTVGEVYNEIDGKDQVAVSSEMLTLIELLQEIKKVANK